MRNEDQGVRVRARARGRGRWAALMGPLACMVLACASAPACAAPEDDYRSGLQSYQGGDVVGAMKGLRTAADAGHAKAQGLLAFILDRSGSPDEAERYYKLAAGQGDADAEVGLAQIYLGRGGHDKDALALLVRAAERGNAVAIESVADGYLKQTLGLTPAARDNKMAVAALLRAAERDYLPAIEGMAAARRSGSFGLTTDTAEAARWQARAEQVRQQRAAAAKRSAASGTAKK